MLFYCIGKIVTTHGIKGEVKVRPETDFNRFEIGKKVFVDQETLTIKSVRKQNELFILQFNELTSLTAVEHLKQKDMYTNEEPSNLSDDEFHLPKLIGLDVFTETHQVFGKVLDIVDVPQGHLLRIKTLDQRIIMIPFVKEFVKSVSDTGIMIALIEGLL